MSILYSGTDALKKDFTKYGKRTFRGEYDDAYNSCVRYVLNNFYDGSRQDSYDIFLGRIDPFKNVVKRNAGVKPSLALLLLVLTLAWFGAGVVMGDGVLGWITFFTAMYLALKFKKPLGKYLVNHPTLDT
jgi:hypothetical protein